MIGFGFGIMYAGLFCLACTLVEYKDVVSHKIEVGNYIYEMAMEIVGWGFSFSGCLLLFGALISGVAYFYKKRKGIR